MISALHRDFRRLVVAVTVCFPGLGLVSTANAVSTYDATAGLTLTLTDVRNATGTQVTTGWSVFAEYQWPSASMASTGDGIAYASATTNVPSSGFLYLDITDSVSLLSTSDGTVSDGTAGSSATNPLYMSIYASLNPGESLTFSFDYDITSMAAAAGDDAIATAAVSL